MTHAITSPLAPIAGLIACLLLTACGGGSNTAGTATLTQTMTKPVKGETCTWKLEDTSFAADLQAIHQSGVVPEKIYCQRNIRNLVPDACNFQVEWFDIFIEVPSSQVAQAKALGYTDFAPPADAEYRDFKCLP